MKDCKLIATEANPLHASGLVSVLRCPWRVVSKFYFEPHDEGGPAAQTGSAMHVAAHAFHAQGGDAASGLEAMSAVAAKFPQADMSDAASLFLAYAADPRNRDAKILMREEPVSFTIQPDESDPTQQPILVVGTLDQVREENGVAKVYDIKTSTRDGTTLLAEHAIQVAAYCIGASIKLNRRVDPGALICPRKYLTAGRDPRNSPPGVFFHFAWDYDDIELLLLGVRKNVAAIRSGDYWHFAGDWCRWCHMRSPDLCVPELQKLRRLPR